ESNINAKIANLEAKDFILIENFKDSLIDRLITIDRKVDIHLQDYVNHKDASLLQGNQLNEKINHTWNKTEKLFHEQKTDIKEIQGFLQKQQNFKIRE
ncbi:MAG: hypothetical protein ACYTX0_51575, partial [Nostoc sp.]